MHTINVFFNKDLFMRPNLLETANLITLPEESLNGKSHLLCSGDEVDVKIYALFLI